MHEHEKRMSEAFQQLCSDPCMVDAKLGQRVVIACGLIGYGFSYERMEAEIIEVAEMSYRVRFKDSDGETVEQWIHRYLVTDVLGAPKECNGEP